MNNSPVPPLAVGDRVLWHDLTVTVIGLGRGGDAGAVKIGFDGPAAPVDTRACFLTPVTA